jgi:hypothetical protein
MKRREVLAWLCGGAVTSAMPAAADGVIEFFYCGA